MPARKPASTRRPAGTTRRAAETRAGRVAIAGRPNVGKSTLLNALLGEPIAITSRHPQTTRDQILGVVTRGATQFVFVDTPGLHRARHKLGVRMNALAREAARGADVVLFVIEPPAPGQAGIAEADLAALADVPAGVPTVLLVNKVDRLKDKSALLPWLETASRERDFTAIVPISARRADGLERIFTEVGARLPVGPKLFEDDALSDKPVRFFVAEFVREQILRKTHQEVPHGVAVVVERFDESRPVVHIELAVIVAREAHKKILIGAKGSMLKAIGIDARARVETLLERQAHLQLWVRAVPDWYESDARLRELGYE
jgi:GTP-binding protein Era